MSARPFVARMLTGPEEWNRRRLQVLFGTATVVALAIIVGIVWSVAALLDSGSEANAMDSDAQVTGSADAPWPVDIEVAQPGPLSTDSAATIELPQPSTLGPAQVGSGFPRAAEGAMSQLIAIDRAAIESVSVVTAQDVITAWAADGGPTARDWSGVVAVRTLLEGAGLPANGASALTVQLEPAMGKIVESGSDSTTVCVDFILTASVQGAQPDRIAVADCQHMAWQSDRWVIAAGPEAEPMPSLWPGTQESIDAGYQWLEVLP